MRDTQHTTPTGVHTTMNKKITKIGKAVAGSALLVGATLTGAAGLASAASGSQDLGDYPTPFVNDDGEVSSTVVVGESAATIDVVGGINIAGSLGNAAFMEESVSVEGGSASWSASEGATLNRANSDLFLNDATDADQTRFDAEDVPALASDSFTSEGGEDIDIDYEANVGTQNQDFSEAGDEDDPSLHLNVPTKVSDSDDEHLISANVEFAEEVNFNVEEDASNVYALEDGDEITLFGTDYTFSSESTESELILYGSSEAFDVENGESSTVDVDGEESTFETVTVAENGDDATIRVDGELESVSETDTVRVNNQDVRVRNIYSTGPDGQGIVQFAVGSEEIQFNNDGSVDVDGDEVDGVYHDVDDVDGFSSVEEMNFYFGAEDTDEEYVAAGEAYEAPLFGLQFHYGGLSGNVAEDPAEAIEVEAVEDGEAAVTVNAEGESADITFATVDQEGDLAVDQDEEIATVEGQELEEDDYVVLNANEESGMYQVTNLDNEVKNIIDEETEGDVSVTLQNAVTGETITIEEDEVKIDDLEGSDYIMEAESVEGKDFDVTFSSDGSAVSFDNGDDNTQVFPSLYTSSDAAMAFTEEAEFVANVSEAGDEDIVTLEMPSTVSSSDQTVQLQIKETSTDGAEDTWAVSYANGSELVSDGLDLEEDEDDAADSAYADITVGQIDYTITLSDDDTVNNGISVSVGVDQDQNTDTNNTALGPAVGVIQPQDDEDEESAYFFEPDVSDNGNGEINVTYTGDKVSSPDGEDIQNNNWVTSELDSEDDMTVGYNDYGAYTSYDTDDDETFTLRLPAAQSTVGMAVTGTDGSLSASGSTSSVTTSTPTGFPNAAALDSDSNIESLKTSDELILVGGPAVNALTAELADEGKTRTADEYSEGSAIVQIVNDAFAEGQDAIVVAGYAGEDTREAANHLANYADNSEDLAGQETVELSTQQTQNAE